MRFGWCCGVVAVAVMFGGAARADDKADVLAAVKTWAAAVSDGDAKTVKANSIGSADEVARWEAMSKMLASLTKLADAAKAKYGAQGADLSKMFKKPDFANLNDGSTVTIDGPDATLTSANGKTPMKLKKEGAAWKVVLASFPDAAKMQVKQIEPMTKALSTTADEILDGQYPTYAEAMKALAGNMAKAKGGGK